MKQPVKVSCGENIQGKIVCAVFEYIDFNGEVYPKFIRPVTIEDIQEELNKTYGTKVK